MSFKQRIFMILSIFINLKTLFSSIIICLFFSISSNAEEKNKKNTTEAQILKEINLMRKNPSQYANNVVYKFIAYYNGKALKLPQKNRIIMQEGASAVRECIRDLEKTPPLSVLSHSTGLSLAAKDHANDQAKTGKTGHKGTDKSTPRMRIERHGTWKSRIAENISYGNFTAREIVVMLLIDDGVKNRGHRTNLLNPVFKKVGIATGKHPVYKGMCVMDFAADFIEKEHLTSTPGHQKPLNCY